MQKILEHGKIFFNAIGGGIFIGIAGTVFLAVPHPVMGAFLFGFGLLTILCCQFKLYTGAIGYLAIKGRNFPAYLWELFLIWTGNLLGCYLVGTLIRASRTFPKIRTRVETISMEKLNDGPLSILILAFFCGILMYCGVELFKRKNLPEICRFALVFLCVSIFILSGFEHCIANMYYYTAAGVWSVKALLSILLMTLGNSLGGMLLPAFGHVQKD